MGRFVAFLVLTVICGVWLYQTSTGYHVTAARYYQVNQSSREDCDQNSCEMVDFTIKLGWNHVIQAECEAFDPNNDCGKLQVGKRYSFERDDSLHYLSQEQNGRNITLGILSEHD